MVLTENGKMLTTQIDSNPKFFKVKLQRVRCFHMNQNQVQVLVAIGMYIGMSVCDISV